ncbi:MAG TPA: hypothetical protein VJ203_00725, partial [Bacteroidales bacterium]|nr:hypothetical protein [Bacteroidales bacterium]
TSLQNSSVGETSAIYPIHLTLSNAVPFIMVSHDERIKSFADRTLHLRDGAIEAKPGNGMR